MQGEPRTSRGEPRRGFSLVECLVGLALLSVALLMGLSLLTQEVRVRERLQTQGAAWAAVEATAELLRAGVLPLTTQDVSPSILPASPQAAGLAVFVQVEPEGREDLYRVRISARYLVRGQLSWRHLETLFWRPAP